MGAPKASGLLSCVFRRGSEDAIGSPQRGWLLADLPQNPSVFWFPVPFALTSLMHTRVCAHTHHAVFCLSENDIWSGVTLPDIVLSFCVCPVILAAKGFARSLCPLGFLRRANGSNESGSLGHSVCPAPGSRDVLGFPEALALLSPRCPELFLSPCSKHIGCL